MSTSPIQVTTVIQDLAKAITSKYDTDANGSLSADEFSGFLSSFLGSMSNNPLTTAARSSSPSTSSIAATAVAERAKVGTMAGFDATKLAESIADLAEVSGRPDPPALSAHAGRSEERPARAAATRARRLDRRQQGRQARFQGLHLRGRHVAQRDRRDPVRRQWRHRVAVGA